MHPTIQYQLARTIAADRAERAPRRPPQAAQAPAPCGGAWRTRGGAVGPPARHRAGQACDRLSTGGPAPPRGPSSPGGPVSTSLQGRRRLSACASSLERAEPFVTKDGSEIRELAGLPTGKAVHQSLAQATVPPGRGHRGALPPRDGGDLLLHRRGGADGPRRGGGRVRAGDCVVIPPGMPHQLINESDEPLVLLCCCAPPYTHDDTVLVRPEAAVLRRSRA